MRLIDADALKELLYYDKATCAVIDDMPTIDPVKHGKLIAAEETNSGGLIRMVCSECGRVIYSTYGLRLADIRFCTYCGAQLEGEEDESRPHVSA